MPVESRAADRAQLRALPEPRQRRRAASPRAPAPRVSARSARAAAAGVDRGNAAAAAVGRRLARRPAPRRVQPRHRARRHRASDRDHAAVAPAQVPADRRRAGGARSRRRHVPRARNARSKRCAARSPRRGRPRKSGASGRRRSTKCARRSPSSKKRCGMRCRCTAARSIGRCASRTGRGLPLDAAPIRFGSWIGGDRDGNPFVTPEVTRSACLMARWTALSLYAKEIEQLRFELSMSDATPELRDQVEGAHEPYRALLRSLQQRLDASRRQIEELLRARRRRTPARRHTATQATPATPGSRRCSSRCRSSSSRCCSATDRSTPPATASSPTAG